MDTHIYVFVCMCVCVCACCVVQRLAGATLLVFANKQDLPGALSAEDIKQVTTRTRLYTLRDFLHTRPPFPFSPFPRACNWTQ